MAAQMLVVVVGYQQEGGLTLFKINLKQFLSQRIWGGPHEINKLDAKAAWRESLRDLTEWKSTLISAEAVLE